MMFLIEALGATASKSSIQAVCLDIIVNTSKWQQIFWLYCQSWKWFLFVE